MIDRRYHERLLKLLSYFPVVGIVGPRQVGKTTLVKSLKQIVSTETVYLDLEYPNDLNKLTDPTLFLEKLAASCVIIDEVQRRPDLFPIIRSLVDQDRRPGRFIILGSASPELIRDSSESLAGRIAYVEITPFNRSEIKPIDIESHWFRGGFPNSLLAPDDELSQIWLSQFVKTYIERDLPMLGFPADPSTTSRFWRMLANHSGNLLNTSQIANSLGLSVPTIKRYINFFENAYLIRLLPPFESNAKKRITKSSKIYLRDTGLMHNLMGTQSLDQLYGNPMIGASWEAYVIEQIATVIPENYQLSFYRTHAGAEMDLVISIANKVIACVEVKFSSNPKLTKGFWTSLDDLNPNIAYVIIPKKTTAYPIHDKVSVVGLDEFLENSLLFALS